MSSILLDTLKGKSTPRPPIWFMRQAGRVLPSYMAIKEKHTFWEMMLDPKLGAKVTLLPLDDLGVDAAILFSDILVVPYAMGMGLDFTEQGPVFEKPLTTYDNPLSALKPNPDKLNYIYRVIDEINKDLPKDIPLIGFCGAPLTVLCYMLQGISRKAEFPEAIRFIYAEKAITKKIIDSVTDLSIEYIKGQIDHGIQVFQLFESHAGLVPLELYKELFFPAIKRIATYVRSRNIPFIFFPKGFGLGYKMVTPDLCDFVSIDWHTSIYEAREMVHAEVGVQGNLDPRVLFGNKSSIEQKLHSYLDFGKENQNWIFNLGHGFMPGIPFENAKFMADWVKQADWGR